jgi:hypothetical protein
MQGWHPPSPGPLTRAAVAREQGGTVAYFGAAGPISQGYPTARHATSAALPSTAVYFCIGFLAHAVI